MKFLFFLILGLTTSTIFSQVKTEEKKELTDGSTVYLQYVDAKITPPSGYIFMDDYSSFLNQNTQTSISVVRDNKMPYQAFVDNMLKRDYSVGNAKLLSSKELEKGYLFTFLFTINNAPVERIVYVTGTAEFCFWCTANYKQSEKDIHYKTLLETLTSLEY